MAIDMILYVFLYDFICRIIDKEQYTYYNENYVIIETCYVRRIKSKISILHLTNRNLFSKHELKLQQSR